MRTSLEPAVELVKSRVPGLVALYLFGSVAREDELPGSDLDFAFLAAKALPSGVRLDLKEDLEVRLHRDVDLIDLRAVSTVMRVRVLEDAELLLDLDPYARAIFEATALSEYTRLNVERQSILNDIRQRGSVYG